MTESKAILIVEDEPLIAMMLEDVLDALGHTVAANADSVSAALSAVEAGGMSAAILDLNLRGGEQSIPVADALADRGIPFVFATGGSGHDIAERHRDRPTLSKPFTMERVEEAIAALA